MIVTRAVLETSWRCSLAMTRPEMCKHACGRSHMANQTAVEHESLFPRTLTPRDGRKIVPTLVPTSYSSSPLAAVLHAQPRCQFKRPIYMDADGDAAPWGSQLDTVLEGQ